MPQHAIMLRHQSACFAALDERCGQCYLFLIDVKFVSTLLKKKLTATYFVNLE